MVSGKRAISREEQDDGLKRFEAVEQSGKKRKRKELTDEEAMKSELESTEDKKKLKKEKKLKKATPKKKAPLDLDKQCGVIVPPNTNPCTRSLTCKIHSMGSKRAVEGRSQPFNDLLAGYQKKDKKPSLHTKGGADTIAQPLSIQHGFTTIAEEEREEEEEVDIDSDEETENVRLAIAQSRPLPLCRKQVFYVRRKQAYFRLRDILLDAITPKHDTNSNDLSQETNPSIHPIPF